MTPFFTEGNFTLPVAVLALALWSMAAWRDRARLRAHTVLSPGVRDAAFVTLFGVMIMLATTSYLSYAVGSGSEITQISAIATRSLALVGGAYALVGTFVKRGR